MIGGKQQLMIKNHVITTNTILYCKKWKETVEFYMNQLKLPVLFSTDWFVEFGLNAMSRLSIADEKRSAVKGCGGLGVTIALEVEDIEVVREHAEKADMKPTQLKIHPWGAQVFYIFDPEGHRIEIWQSSKPVEMRERNSNQK